MEPLTQLTGRSKIAQPPVHGGALFAETARPETIHQNAGSVAARGRFINALQGDGHGLLYYCKVVALPVLTDPGMTRPVRVLRQQWEKSVATSRARCLRGLLAGLVAWFSLASTLGCDVQRRKSDAELGLTAQQAAGRRIYEDRCERCHEPYLTKDKKGPGLQGLFKHQYLSVSGLPATDERVLDIVRHGRKDMPGYSQVLTPQQMADLLDYLHTL